MNNTGLFNDRRLPPTNPARQNIAVSREPAQWTTIRTEQERLPSNYGTANNLFQHSIPLDTTQPIHRLTIKLTEAEYQALQKLYDFTDEKFANLDQLVRDFILQPEMIYRFLDFLSMATNNDAIDFIVRNKVSDINWV